MQLYLIWGAMRVTWSDQWTYAFLFFENKLKRDNPDR